MRKSITLILFCLLFNSNLFAQEGAYLGVKFGGGFSRYYFAVDPGLHEPIELDFVPVYEAGLVFNHQTAKFMGLQIEMQYAQKAWQERYGGDTIAKVLIHYIEMPVLTRARFSFGKMNSALIVNLGIYGAYAFGSDNETNKEGPDALINYGKSFENTFDFGFKAGLGYEIPINRSSIQLQVMFSQGLQDLFDRDRLGIYRSLNQSLFASVIYKIPLFKKVKIE